MASTSSSVTVVDSPEKNACPHKDLEEAEQPRTTDKSFYKQIYRKWLQIERAALAVIILIILGVYLIPVIFFYIPQSSSVQEQPLPPMNSCASAFLYIGDICREELLSQKENCFLELQPSDILVLKNISNSAVEQINAISPECREVSMPFLCLYFSGGICDENGMHLIATRKTCTEISNGACQIEFERARSNGLNVPDCSGLPEEQINCSAITSGNPPSIHQSNKCTLMCQEDFMCDDSDNSCKPICGSWSIYSSALSTTLFIVKIFCAIIGSISAIVLFVIAGLRFKKVFVFPSVFAIYGNISIFIYILFFFIGIIGRGSMCTSRNFLESVKNPTPICILRGFFSHYLVLQFHICWVLHATSLFVIIKFPYKFRSLKKSTKLKYIHIGCVIAVLVIPLICALIPMMHAAGGNSVGRVGYVMITTDSLSCLPSDSNVVFYTSVLPSLLLAECGIALLIITIWLIHKNYGLFKVKHSQSKNPFKFGTPEKKLLIIFAYYIVFHVISYIYYILSLTSVTERLTELQNYVTCESRGLDPENPCDKSMLEKYYYPSLELLTYILIFLIPLVNLVFVIDVQQRPSFPSISSLSYQRTLSRIFSASTYKSH